MVRGIERTAIVRDVIDRADFVARLALVAEAGAFTVYAWAVLPNHSHLLVRTGSLPLARSMRSLLTGYAGAFNRRHKRVGHLFQNRYKSVVVEEECYLLELVRYLHLNPLRAGLVPDLRALDRYPWAGHSALLGTVARPWQATEAILVHFGRRPANARAAYRAFVAAGIAQGHRRELQGGGLVRSAGGWSAVASLRRGREAYLSDERILGSPEFVEAVRREVARGSQPPARPLPLAELVRRVCESCGVAPEALTGRGRRPAVSQARAGIAYWWVERLGQSGRALAPVLGLHPAVVYKAARRGAARAAVWQERLGAASKVT
jgi:REP element-mobilizing transposase RayT